MVEKVLGFKEKDASFCEGIYIRTFHDKNPPKGTRRAGIRKVKCVQRDEWRVKANKLVPVVSVKFLKNKIKKLIHHYGCRLAVSSDLFVEEMNELLSDIDKEASNE